MFQYVGGERKLLLLSSVWEKVLLLLFEYDCIYFVLLLLVWIFVFVLFVFILIVILFWLLLLLLLLSTQYNRTMNGIDNRYASMLLSDVSKLIFIIFCCYHRNSSIAVGWLLLRCQRRLLIFLCCYFSSLSECLGTYYFWWNCLYCWWNKRCCWCYLIYFVTGNVSYYCCFHCKRGSYCCCFQATYSCWWDCWYCWFK